MSKRKKAGLAGIALGQLFLVRLFFVFPVVEVWQGGFVEFSCLLRGEGFAGGVVGEEYYEFGEDGVDEFSVGEAQFTVVLVEAAVGVAGEGGVVEWHSAALADEVSRGVEEGVDGYVVEFGEELEGFGVWGGFAGFPAGDCLTGYVYFGS